MVIGITEEDTTSMSRKEPLGKGNPLPPKRRNIVKVVGSVSGLRNLIA